MPRGADGLPGRRKDQPCATPQSRWFTLATGATLVTALIALPRLLLGEASAVLIHDNLDSEFLYRALVARPDRVFDYDAIVQESLGGLPRSYLVSGLNLTVWLFMLLPTFWAYALNQGLVHVLGFVGMYLLARDCCAPLVSPRTPPEVPWLVALAFSLLPFFSIHGLTVAGVPWVAWALINLVRRTRLASSFAVVALFPLYSTFATGGVFVLAAAAAAYAIVVVRRRDPMIPLLSGIALMTLVYIVCEWHLMELMVLGTADSVSHRSLWLTAPGDDGWSTGRTVHELKRYFVHGQYHAPSLHEPILWLLPVIALMGWRLPSPRGRAAALGLLGLLVANAIVYVGYNWEGFTPIRAQSDFLRTFNLRFYWLQPTLWYALLGLLGAALAQHAWGRRAFAGFMVFQLVWITVLCTGFTHEYQDNLELIVDRALDRESEIITYEQYVSAPLFDRISERIGRPKSSYRVGSVGLHPSVALLNGFRNVDGYNNNYPLTYKAPFRRVIAREIERDPAIRDYFDHWGNRAYLFSTEIGREQLDRRSAGLDLVIDELGIDLEAFEALGGEYIFSVAEVRDPAFLGATELIGRFSDPGSAWQIYVYGHAGQL